MTAAPFAFGTLLAVNLVLVSLPGPARAGSVEDSAELGVSGPDRGVGTIERPNRPGQGKKTRGSSAKKAEAREAEAARDRARSAIRADDYKLAERLIRKGLKARKKAERDAWRLVDSELAFARKRYAKSGLIAMRIVILRPKSGHVGAALYRAARAYAGLGRPRKAAELYSACVEHKTTQRALRIKAEKRLKKLVGRRPKP